MATLATRNFYKTNITKEWLNKNNFRYEYNYSDDTENMYSYRFSCLKDYIWSVLDCRIMVSDKTGKVRIDVLDPASNGLYAPWYYVECGNYTSLLAKVDNRIKNELSKLGIEEEGTVGKPKKKRKNKNGRRDSGETK